MLWKDQPVLGRFSSLHRLRFLWKKVVPYPQYTLKLTQWSLQHIIFSNQNIIREKQTKSTIRETKHPFNFSISKHRRIIRAGMTCKNIPCYIHESACRWFIIKLLIYFKVMLKNIFEFYRMSEIAESWMAYGIKFSWIAES